MTLISFTISDSTFVLRVRSDAVSCCVMCIVHIHVWVFVLYFGDKKYWAQGSVPADVKRFLLKNTVEPPVEFGSENWTIVGLLFAWIEI